MVTHSAVGASLGGSALAMGLSARVASVPAGWSSRSLLVGGQGLNDTMFCLGSALLAVGGKARLGVAEAADPATRFLSSWQDNGAFYYYHSEHNKTYQETMVESVAYSQSLGLPLGSLQFDSWWYFKNTSYGGKAWEPTPRVCSTAQPSLCCLQ